MNDLETFKELLCGMAEAKSTTELWFKQAAFMLWCGDNPDKLAALIAAHPQPLVDAEAAAKEIANAIPWGDGTPDERLARRDEYARIIAEQLRQHSQERAGWESKIPGLVNGIRSLILFHTKNGTMHGDCASDFAELVAPYPSFAPSGEVIDEQAAAPDSAGKK